MRLPSVIALLFLTCASLSAQATTSQKTRLYNEAEDFLRYRQNVFGPCKSCSASGTDNRSRPAGKAGATSQLIACSNCKGTSRVISRAAFDFLIECFAAESAPRVTFSEYSGVWNSAMDGRQPEPEVIKSIWASGRLYEISQELRVIGVFGRLDRRGTRFEVRNDGVLLAWTKTNLNEEDILWAWMKTSADGENDRYRWLVVSARDIETWTVEFARIKEKPVAELAEIRELLFNPTFGPEAEEHYATAKKRLVAFEKDWSNLLHLREYRDLESCLRPRKLQIELGDDPVIEEAVDAFEKEAKKLARSEQKETGSKEVTSEGFQLATNLAYHQRARPARIARGLSDMPRLEELLANRPHLAKERLESITSRDPRLKKSEECTLWSAKITEAIAALEVAQEKARAKAKAEETARSVTTLAATLIDENPDEALSLLDSAIRTDASFPESYRLRMRYHFEHTHFDDALDDAEKVLSLATNDPEAALIAGTVHSLGGRSDLAQDRLALIRTVPEKDDANRVLYEFIRGLVAEAAGDKAGAISAAGRARTAVKKSASLNLERMITDLEIRNTPPNQRDLEPVGERMGDRLEELDAIGAASDALRSHQYATAIKFAGLEPKQRQEALVISGLAKLFSGEARYLAGAKEDLSAALRLLRNDPRALLYRGVAHQRAGQTSRASSDFEAAAAAYTARRGLDELSIQTEAKVRLSALWVELGIWDDALESATAATRAHGGDLAPASFNRAVAHFHNGNYRAAIDDLDSSIRLAFPAIRSEEPENYNRTMIRPFSDLISVFPLYANESEYQAVALFQRGCAYFEAKERGPALQDFKTSKLRDHARFGAYFRPWWTAKEASMSEEELPQFAEFHLLMTDSNKDELNVGSSSSSEK